MIIITMIQFLFQKVHDAQLDFFGTRLATCSSDRTVKIFEVVDGKQTHVADLRGHEGPVWQVGKDVNK